MVIQSRNGKGSHRLLAALAFAVLALALAGGVYIFLQSRMNIFPQALASLTSTNERAPFPAISDDNLSDEQQKILQILEREYELNPSGTKYSEDIEEPWCADFVSWVYKEADVPLENPNSGYWRIPGTYTLREYYEQTGRFRPSDSNYMPKFGDTMLYDNPSTFGQHVNFVIQNNNGIVTTIGGNEPGGIRIVTHEDGDTSGFVGYGVLETL